MKIHVIDNIGRIPPRSLVGEGDVRFFSDEVLALNAVAIDAPELVLLNFAVLGSRTASYIDLLLSSSPGSSVVVIGDELPDEVVLGCFLVGAKGYQNERQLTHYISKIVKVIAAGEAWISRRMTARLLEVVRQQKQMILESLTLSALTFESSSRHF